MEPKTRVREFLAALSFLTVLPVGRNGLPVSGSATLWAFPLVGALVGLLGGAVFWASWHAGLPPSLSAIMAVAAQVMLTGGLHEDGLADVADGLGGRTKEKRFDIMRDSRIGTFGVLALILGLSLRIGLIASLADTAAHAADILPALVVSMLVISGAISRAALPTLMYCSSPAREDGLGQGFGTPDGLRCWAAILFGAMAAMLLVPFWQGTTAILGALLIAASLHVWTRRWIGGYTGDTLGAAQQLLEISVLFVLVLYPAAG